MLSDALSWDTASKVNSLINTGIKKPGQTEDLINNSSRISS